MSHALAPMRPRYIPRRIPTAPVPMPVPARAPQSIPVDRLNCMGCGDDHPAHDVSLGLCGGCRAQMDDRR